MRWAPYSLDPRPTGKPAKVPRHWRKGHRISTRQPEQWTSRRRAAESVKRHGYAGVGVLIQPGLVVVDLDDCIDWLGEVEPWAQEVVEVLDSYTEVSPSGTGLHVFLRGKCDFELFHSAGRQIELYAGNSPRYCTVTGDVYQGRRTLTRWTADKEAWVSGHYPPSRAEHEHAERAPEPSAEFPDLGADIDAILGAKDRSHTLQSFCKGCLGVSDEDLYSYICGTKLFEIALEHREYQGGKARLWVWTHHVMRSRVTRGLEFEPEPEGEEPEADALRPADPLPEPITEGLTDVMRAAWRAFEADALRPQPVYILGATLATFSALIGHQWRDSTGAPCRVYALNVGPTTSGKEAGVTTSGRLLAYLGRHGIRRSDAGSGAGIEDALAELGGEVYFTFDEFGPWLREYRQSKSTSGVVPALLKFFSKHNEAAYPTRSLRATKGQEVRYLRYPYVTLLGTTTERAVLEGLTEDDAETGLLNRLLFFISTRRRVPRNPHMHWDEESADVVRDWYERLNAFAGDGLEYVPYSDEAWRLREAYLDEVDMRLDAMETDLEASPEGRAAEMIAGFALMRALTRDADAIDVEDWTWGQHVMTYCAELMRTRILPRVAASDHHRVVADMEAYITGIVNSKSQGFLEFVRNAVCPRRMLHQRFKKLKPKEFDEAIDTMLHTSSHIKVAQIRPRASRHNTTVYYSSTEPLAKDFVRKNPPLVLESEKPQRWD